MLVYVVTILSVNVIVIVNINVVERKGSVGIVGIYGYGVCYSLTALVGAGAEQACIGLCVIGDGSYGEL